MDTTKGKDRTTSPLTVPVVANADTVTLERRTTLNESTVGTEGKSVENPTCVTTTFTKVIDDDEQPKHDPRLDKSKSTKVKCVECNRDLSKKQCRKRKLEGNQYMSLRKKLSIMKDRDIIEDEYVCGACYLRHHKESTQTSSQASCSQQSSSEMTETDEQLSCLRLASVNNDEHHCLIC